MPSPDEFPTAPTDRGRGPDTERDACGIGFVADATGRPSRAVVDAALSALTCVIHRGALAADDATADGSGLLLPIPPSIFGAGRGVASLMVRGSIDPRPAFEAAAAAEGITVEAWRRPPVDPDHIGVLARRSQPDLVQAILRRPQVGGEERAAWRLRRRVTQHPDLAGVYVVSCSWRTIVYKGLVAADLLARFYPDLADPAVEANFALFHQRFSTNTSPTWERTQPYRSLCHNGEINAITGNAAAMAGRGALGTEGAGLGAEALARPVLAPGDSDSGMLDSAVELLVRGGRDIRHAVSMLVPPAWEGDAEMDPAVRAFFRYHSALVEPWDGPAGIIFTDGVGIGAALDRNGLRPLRYAVCSDGLVAVCSEAGAVDVSGHGTVSRGRLGPGQMLFVDPDRGVLRDGACKERLSAAGPYARWNADGFIAVDGGHPMIETGHADELVRRQRAHGFTVEEHRMITGPMAADAKEPTFAMGDDTALPSLSGRPRPLHHLLRQRFAQVTNPPIDHLRERTVMSLRSLIGPRQPLLSERREATRLVELDSVVIYPSRVTWLTDELTAPFPAVTLDATFAAASGPSALSTAIDDLASRASAAVADGVGVIVIDHGAPRGDRAPIPSLLAVGAVHHRLGQITRRPAASIVVVADDVFDVHAMACLVALGADAICPRLALETVAADADASDERDVVAPEAQEHLRTAFEDGLLKILSKMGIATIASYRGAALLEAVGLDRAVTDRCCPGVPSVVGGLGWEHLGADVLANHAAAWAAAEEPELVNPGWIRDRKRGGDLHLHTKAVVDALHAQVASAAATPSPSAGNANLEAARAAAHLLRRAIAGGSQTQYDAFAATVNDRPPMALRDLLEMIPAGDAVAVDDVEPVGSIAQRFSTGAMSHGSLSAEAHETLAAAMNLIGGRSNCGEGGEDPGRFATRGRSHGDTNSRIKQVASGRFGVTPRYCAMADELQIKMAQGSKPGEGGQLPGHKVSEEIARLRHTQPGVTLISPPPHHDIYSIEDLAQLIFDLGQVNGFADVSVKLVSERGVGTVASGVVKALADVVHISGADGGTGASPLSSIKHAGMPWELGLAETQASLVANDLRTRVRVRVDGCLMTGRDVVVAALLGADEFSFGTAAMIAEGCIMLRACHKDTCSVGIATQRPHLRAKFTGTPEGVASYMLFVADEVRRLLAGLGLRSLDEAIGRVELLRQRRTGDDRTDALDLTPLLQAPADPSAPRCYQAGVARRRPRSALGDRILADAYRAVWDGDTIDLSYPITNRDRTVGAALGGALALEFSSIPPGGAARIRLEGSAGQSFGAFLVDGVHLDLIGEANDYVGKAMGGGTVSVRPPPGDAGNPVLAGNTCLYGATSGELFVAGQAGERFAVRNSGALAVVEGTGDHLCEYMTGGTVVVLGPVGRNVGAGMTGGQLFVWDPDGRLPSRVNPGLVAAERLDAEGATDLRHVIERHVTLTDSVLGRELLDDWWTAVVRIWAVLPLGRAREYEARTGGRAITSA